MKPTINPRPRLPKQLVNASLRIIKNPINWSRNFTSASFKKMRTPVYVSLLGVAAVTGTSFKKKMPLTPDAVTRDSYTVVVYKSKYEMRVYDSTGEWLVTYPVVFGNKDQSDKMMEGDRKTPEGNFHIASKRKHEKWNSFMALDYPTKESYEKFNQRKAAGLIPSGARIGGSIGIHGTWPHEEFAIDQYQNWTEGCISTKNAYIEEIFGLLPVGTQIQIKR